MKNISIFCLTLDPDHEKTIEKLSYIPVGLGSKNFQKNVLLIKQVKISLIKTNFTANILFTIGFGKII